MTASTSLSNSFEDVCLPPMIKATIPPRNLQENVKDQDGSIGDFKIFTALSTTNVTVEKSSSLTLSPTSFLKPRQLFYIFIFHGLGNFFICGFVNLLINYLLNRDVPSQSLPVYEFPVGIVTSILVTVFVQGVLCFLIGGALTIRDVVYTSQKDYTLESRWKRQMTLIIPSLLIQHQPKIIQLLLFTKKETEKELTEDKKTKNNENFKGETPSSLRLHGFYFGVHTYSVWEFLKAVFSAILFGVSNVFIFFIPTVIAIVIITETTETTSWSLTTWYIFISLYCAALGFIVEVFIAYIGLIIASVSLINKTNIVSNASDNSNCRQSSMEANFIGDIDSIPSITNNSKKDVQDLKVV